MLLASSFIWQSIAAESRRTAVLSGLKLMILTRMTPLPVSCFLSTQDDDDDDAGDDDADDAENDDAPDAAS